MEKSIDHVKKDPRKVTNKIPERDMLAAKIIAYTLLGVMAFLALAPFVVLIASSFTSEKAISFYGYGFIPREWSMDAWKYLWEARSSIGMAYLMTILVTVVGTTLSVIITSMFAYGLAQKDVPGLKIIMLVLMLTMIFNGGMVSSYIVWNNYMNIGDTFWALILPNLLMSSFTVILVLSYYKTSIPGELLEAARIDGAGEFTIYFQIVLPLSTPILATIGMMAALAYWNDWTNGLYYISDKHSELFTIQQLLNKMNENIAFLQSNPNLAGEIDIPSASVRMAICVAGILPLIIAFPFFQKYFAQGLTLGSVKG